MITPLLRRDTFNKVGGFDERLRSAEDCDLALRMACVSRLIGMNLPLILKREHAASLSGDRRLNARMWLIVLNKFNKAAPELVLACMHAYRRTLGRDFLRLGRETLCRYKTPRQLAAARYYLARAIGVYPRHTRALVYLLWAYIYPLSYRRWRRLELRMKEPLRQPLDD